MVIQDKISSIKDSAKFKAIIEIERLIAASKLEKLLNDIDFSSEVVRTDNFENLKNLFFSLKNDELTNDELKVIDEIVGR